MGACAGICYNALWFFPVLIVVGGLVTVIWDVWLARKIGKAKAKWENRRRRTRDEVGDAEETVTSQDIQPPVELQIQRPEAVKQRVQAGTSTDHITATGAAAEPGRADSQESMTTEAAAGTPPVADIKTHNISIKLGVSLILGFFGK
jgi:hypothetical protein